MIGGIWAGGSIAWLMCPVAGNWAHGETGATLLRVDSSADFSELFMSQVKANGYSVVVQSLKTVGRRWTNLSNKLGTQSGYRRYVRVS